MAVVYQNIGQVFLMLLLLCCSAFFSGSETAFFNLSRRQKQDLQKSKHKLQNLAGRLADSPKRLLSCLLFGNMVVNVLFYALASMLTLRVRREIGLTASGFTAGMSFIVLVMFGEIMPKSLAYGSSRPVSLIASLPLAVCLRVFGPIIFILRIVAVEPAIRLLLGAAKRAKPMTGSEFRSLLEASRNRGLITADENRLLAEIIEFGSLKVRHVMRPRVDMIACAVTDSPHTARQKIQKHHLTKLAVYLGTVDNVIGLVHLRDILLRPDVSLDKIVRRVNFVPEQKTVESLLEFFRKTATDTAVVVDEYGGIAGSVRLEDIAEELLGPIGVEERTEMIQSVGPLQYRLAGSLAIHDWADAFGVNVSETRLATIGGLVTELLGKIPRCGDEAYLGNLKFRVERVRHHRIETVVLSVEPIVSDDD